MAITPPQSTIPPMKEAGSKCCPGPEGVTAVVDGPGVPVISVGELSDDIGDESKVSVVVGVSVEFVTTLLSVVTSVEFSSGRVTVDCVSLPTRHRSSSHVPFVTVSFDTQEASVDNVDSEQAAK
jgi:hypothetical protein